MAKKYLLYIHDDERFETIPIGKRSQLINDLLDALFSPATGTAPRLTVNQLSSDDGGSTPSAGTKCNHVPNKRTGICDKCGEYAR